MKLLFEWDATKARSNFKKHGITFEEATTVLGDPRAITIKSGLPSEEARFVTIGLSGVGTLIITSPSSERKQTTRFDASKAAQISLCFCFAET